ncbi:MAG: DegT/DnrJ/EryC1/StrS family aminotransferase [Lachnospiraceae bacterium]|nr:DegT/DnrJ/EryC1/StrS family aminotransferase [Lachnospiraceae bacterium]
MQFKDLSAQYNALRIDIDKAIADTIESGNFILGEKVIVFEQRLAKYTGVKHCISCANGTDALTMVLKAWGVGLGDAVFVPDLTYIATASSVAVLGAEPVFVDIDAHTFNISPTSLANAITRVLDEGRLTPKVIITVDLFGLLADYENIEKIAKKYSLLVLEDAAQGFGGSVNMKKACSFGDAAITSFFPAKPLGCYGDGGAIFTNDDAMYDYLIMYRRNGATLEDKYDNRIIGINSRLDAIQAAILSVKLDAFDSELKKVNQIAMLYNEKLGDYVKTPYIPTNYFSSRAQYTVLLPDEQSRDLLRLHLTKRDIPTMIYFPKPLHRQTAFNELNTQDEYLQTTIKTSKCVLSLPIHPYLSTGDVDYICTAIIEKLS